MSIIVDLAERGILSDGLIRWGIRRLDRERLRSEDRGDPDKQREATDRFVEGLRQAPIAVRTEKPKEQPKPEQPKKAA